MADWSQENRSSSPAAAGGIGEGIARDLAAEGARVAVADIDLAAAERVAAAIGKDGGEAIACR